VKVTAALVREQQVTFAVVVVKPAAMQPHNREATARSCQPLFPGVPVVLVSQDSRGVPSYYGRSDISRFLSGVEMSRLPWREYTAA
jgi:hypothetical protein